MQWETIITAGVGAIIGAGGITPLVVAVLKAKRSGASDERTFAKATFDRMERRITFLEAAEKECVKDREKLFGEVAAVRAELSAAHREIEQLQAETVVGRVQSDTAGIIRAFSNGAERMFGWRAEDAIGRAVEILIPPYVRPQYRAALKQAAANEIPVGPVRGVVAVHRSGRTFPVNVVLNTYVNETGDKVFDAEIRYRNESEESQWRDNPATLVPKTPHNLRSLTDSRTDRKPD